MESDAEFRERIRAVMATLSELSGALCDQAKQCAENGQTARYLGRSPTEWTVAAGHVCAAVNELGKVRL